MAALVGGTTRRDQILVAVLEVVRSEGWTAVSMRRVADPTGITATALYGHFDDREALVAAAVVLAGRFLLLLCPPQPTKAREKRAALMPATCFGDSGGFLG